MVIEQAYEVLPEFARAVHRELNEKATPEDMRMLLDDPETWRQELVAIQRKIDNELTREKAKALRRGGPVAHAEFTRIKADLITRKDRIIKSLMVAKLAKAEMREAAEIEEEEAKQNLLADILEELRKLNAKFDRLTHRPLEYP